MVYNTYFYDSEKDAVVVTDMDGKQLVIDCKKAEAQVMFDKPEDAGILARFAREEPVGYVGMTMRLGGLQDYVNVIPLVYMANGNKIYYKNMLVPDSEYEGEICWCYPCYTSCNTDNYDNNGRSRLFKSFYCEHSIKRIIYYNMKR